MSGWWPGATEVPWLTLLWLVPAIGSFLALTLPKHRPDSAKWFGLGVTLATLGIAITLAFGFESSAGTMGSDRFQLVEDHSWIPAIGTRYALGLDGIGLVLVLLTAGLLPLLLVAGWRDADGRDPEQTGPRSRPVHTYVALTLAVEAMVLMSFVALDILLFYIFFEAMLIPLYFLIGGFGSGPDRSAAAVKFLLYNLFGGLIMLAAVVGLYVVTARSSTGATFDLRAVSAAAAAGDLDAGSGVLKMLFLGFMFAFAVKAPLWPFHTWLPDAAVAATPTSAVLMMAVVDKVGTFAMLRFALQIFPDAAAYFAPLIVTLAVIGIVYGAILAIGQTDLMRLIAYTSISHFGFIILGIFAFTGQSQSGATLYMVNHGISTAALFLIAGFLVSRRGTRMIADYGGVQRVAPVLAGTFLIAGLATLSLPGLAPFISEFLVLIGSFTRYPVAAIVASSALVLAAIYILWTYQRMMTGPVRLPGLAPRRSGPGTTRQPVLDEQRRLLPDLNSRELVVVVPLLIALAVLGVYPKPVLDVIDPAVANTSVSVGVLDEGGEP